MPSEGFSVIEPVEMTVPRAGVSTGSTTGPDTRTGLSSLDPRPGPTRRDAALQVLRSLSLSKGRHGEVEGPLVSTGSTTGDFRSLSCSSRRLELVEGPVPELAIPAGHGEVEAGGGGISHPYRKYIFRSLFGKKGVRAVSTTAGTPFFISALFPGTSTGCAEPPDVVRLPFGPGRA